MDSRGNDKTFRLSLRDEEKKGASLRLTFAPLSHPILIIFLTTPVQASKTIQIQGIENPKVLNLPIIDLKEQSDLVYYGENRARGLRVIREIDGLNEFFHLSKFAK